MTKISKFTQQVIKSVSKSDKEVLTERLEDFVQDCIVECKAQISHIETALIPGKKNEITRAERALEKATKAFESERFGIFDNFIDYVNNRNVLQSKVDYAEKELSRLQNELSSLEQELERFNEVLADFQ